MTDLTERSSSRRDLLLRSLGIVAAGAVVPPGAMAALLTPVQAAAPARGAAGFRERSIMRDGHRIYVRDYPGSGPAFVLIHGFPDNSRIYEDLAPLLSAAGRRVVAFDFLGFGASDKPPGFIYSFDQQLADLNAVVDGLKLGTIVPVGHDAGGPAAVNFALDHKDRVSSLVLLNSYYDNSAVRSFPDFIELCCNPKTRLLARAMMTDPKQAAYLFGFQQELLRADMPPRQRDKFDRVMQPIIASNFGQAPSAMPAFLAMTGDAYANLAANDRRVPELREFGKPVSLIWGVTDKYLSKALAQDIAAKFPNATLTELAANHWPQSDMPEDVAKAMLR